MPKFNTSGTTGKPKNFNLTDEQMKGRMELISDETRGAGLESVKRLFIDFPQSSYIGANFENYAKAKNMEYYFASLGSADKTVDFFKRQNIEGIVSTPQGLYNYAKAASGSHKFKWLYVCTSQLTPALSRAIRASMGNNLWSSYATSEIGVISIVSAEQIESIPNCVGKVVPDVTLKIADDGEILLKSAVQIAGYEDEPHLTSKHFIDGWYHSGDMGHMQGDLLILEGRKRT